MNLQLKDKVVIITGGSAGIGKGISLALAAEGAIPFVVGRTKESVQETVDEILVSGAKVGSYIAELTDPEQCKDAVESAIATFGRIDGLVNNAGMNDSIGLESGNYKDFMRSIERNLTHYYMMAHFTLPELKKNVGAIVNIGSKTSITGQGGTSGYAASNGGRNALTREWAVELLPYKIRVNAIIVAESFTPLYQRWINTFSNAEQKLKAINDKIPFEKRMTTVEEIAKTTVFLLSQASSHTTGQLIHVDGGYVHLDRAIS